MTIEAELFADVTDIAPWQRAWDDVYAGSCGEPSVSHEWTSALLRSHVRAGDRVYLLVLKRAGEIVGFIPLVAQQDRFFGGALTTLSPLSERYNTHTDLLSHAESTECVDALLNALSGEATRGPAIRWDVFRVGRLLERQPLCDALEERLRARRFAHRVQYTPPSFYLELPDSMHAYLASRSGKLRNYLRRIDKKIAALGAVSFEVADNAADIDYPYRKLLHIENNSWKHEHGTAISAVKHQTTFYRNLCFGAGAANHLHLSLLHIDNEPVAYNLGYLFNNRYSYLKTSYIERLRSTGVASLARARLIEDLIGRGVHSLDFPGEPYEWEQQWTDTLRWHKSLVIFNRNARGQAFRLLSDLRRKVKKEPEGKHLEFCDARALQAPEEKSD